MEEPPIVLSDLYAATQLIVRTDVMALVVLLASAAAWLGSGWLQARAAAPGASHWSCLRAGPRLLVGPRGTGPRARMRAAAYPAETPARQATSLAGLVPDSLAAASRTVTLGVLLPGAALGAAFLVRSGHLPTGWAQGVLAAASLVTVAGLVVTVARLRRTEGRRDWLAARGPHLTAATLAGEVLLVGASLATVWAITHTEGAPTSLLDIAAASLAARAATLLRLPPAGLVVADVAFVTLLIGIGVSPAAAVAAVAVWRAGLATVWVVTSATRLRRPHTDPPPLGLSSEPTGSPLGEWFHRGVFRALGALPPAAAAAVRARVFQTLFSMSEDPWRYDTMPYESRKRQQLLEHLPAEAGVVVEVGCADGHNLLAIGRTHPEAQVVGVDISAKAVAAAAARAVDVPNVTVLQADARSAPAVLARAGIERVDVLVLAEILYYIGGPRQVETELASLAPLLAPGGTVIFVHQASHADRLHAAAVRGLRCRTVQRLAVDDAERPYVVEVARP